MPLDLAVIRRDALAFALRRRIPPDDPYFRAVQSGWSDALRQAYMALPEPDAFSA